MRNVAMITKSQREYKIVRDHYSGLGYYIENMDYTNKHKMRNLNDLEDDYDYSPNELARLSSGYNDKYREIVNSNLESGDTIENWQQRNLESAQDYLAQQRANRRNS